MSEPLNMVTLFDFTENEQLKAWRIIPDGVMGGRSSGRFYADGEGHALFEGHVSLENNGGFSSARAWIPKMVIPDKTGIRIRVRGDGQRYSFRLKNDRDFDGISYAQSFHAPRNEWIEISLPFDQFIPVYRGRRLQGIPGINSEDIRQTGILISDKQEGPFQLVIDWIKCY